MQELSRVSQQSKKEKQGFPWPIVLTFVAGLFLSLSIYQVLTRWELDNQRLAFESRSRDYSFAIKNDLSRSTSVLKGIGDSVQIFGIGNRDQFRRLVTPSLNRNKSIQAISWNPVVTNRERPSLVKRARDDGLDYFQFSERNTDRELIRASDRERYVVVYFIEPLGPNQFALGYDIDSNPTRHRAIEKAFRSCEMVATERITLVQETGSMFGVLILNPIFNLPEDPQGRATRRGLLVEVLRAGDVVQKALSRFEKSPQNVQLIDVTEDTPQELYSSESPMSEPHDVQCPQCYRSTFQFCQRKWQLAFHPTPTKLESASHWQSWFPALLSFLFSLTVCVYLWTRLQHIESIKETSQKQAILNESLAKEIEDRKKAESLQREGEIYLQSIAENIPVAVVLSDPEGRVKYVNKGFQREFSKGIAEVLNQTPRELFSAAVFEQMQQALTKAKLGQESSFEFKLQEPKQSRFFAGTFLPQFDGEALVGFMTFIKDVTDEKKAAETRLQSQKLQSLGTLAGGIAHEFNNLLTIILGNTKLHLESIPASSSESKNYLESAYEAALKAKELSQQILTFSRRETIHKKVIDLSATITSTLKILSATTPAHIQVKTLLPKERCLILASPTQIQQVLLNLCTNAYHAIPRDQEGELSIECSRLDDETARLIVRDNGSGIPEELQPHIFDPFFTTKEVGKGTGLGLAVVHGIIEGHQGQIQLQSAKGQGSAFLIDFPLAKQGLKTDSSKQIAIGPLEGSKHVLVVEDEGSIRKLYKNYLSRQGFTVTTSPNGVEALELFEEDPDRFDLVLTDQSMPKMTGAELSAQLLQRRPTLPIILSTGFSESFKLQDAQRLGIQKCLSKPVDLTTLTETIIRLLQ